mmetsp:Transcript_16242/g.42059  ORF Transcript_16242/g.42059 Transcript_16242/m.42059 type:complete len:81 (-) Transcript_16242:1347-1589(-)
MAGFESASSPAQHTRMNEGAHAHERKSLPQHYSYSIAAHQFYHFELLRDLLATSAAAVTSLRTQSHTDASSNLHKTVVAR